MIRTVTGVVNRIDGQPWGGVEVRFDLIPGSYDLEGSDRALYPTQTLATTTDEVGRFTVGLWANEEGEIASSYLCQIQGDRFEFTVPPAIEAPLEIDLVALRARGVEPFASPVPPKPERRQTFAPVSGQVNFQLSSPARYPHLSRLWVNGVKYVFAVDYLIDNLTVVWLSTIRLESTDFLEILY